MQNCDEHVRELCVACVQTGSAQIDDDEEAHAQNDCRVMAGAFYFLFEVKTLRNHGVAVERLRESMHSQVAVT